MENQEHQMPPHESFSWHPEYAGKSAREVQRELASQIQADQRQYRLAMDGAEEAEHDALTSVVTLERRWGYYDFDWADLDADALADRIVAFELERERRQEMISWSEYRAGAEATGDQVSETTASTEPTTMMKGISLLVLAVIIVVIVVVMVGM